MWMPSSHSVNIRQDISLTKSFDEAKVSAPQGSGTFFVYRPVCSELTTEVETGLRNGVLNRV